MDRDKATAAQDPLNRLALIFHRGNIRIAHDDRGRQIPKADCIAPQFRQRGIRIGGLVIGIRINEGTLVLENVTGQREAGVCRRQSRDCLQ